MTAFVLIVLILLFPRPVIVLRVLLGVFATLEDGVKALVFCCKSSEGSIEFKDFDVVVRIADDLAPLQPDRSRAKPRHKC